MAVCADDIGRHFPDLAGAQSPDGGVSPLKRLILQDIARTGPMPVSRYMALCLSHPEHGYYVQQRAIGAAGDFITAPEISQMFGELIGLWAADLWQRAGAPAAFRLIELGPGRGVMMADALRAAAHVPGFISAAQVAFVEINPALKAAQASRVPGARWHDDVHAALAGDLPCIILANEYFDALPVEQDIHTPEGWQTRTITAEGNQLVWSAPAASQIRESGPVAQSQMQAISGHLARVGGAVLVIDYGPARSGPGDTLQAVRAHTPVDPLATPGEADLTAHVDFQALGAAATGLQVHGPIGQGVLLRRLGIDLRCDQLARQSPEAAQSLYAGVRRLTHPDAMGRLFKAMAATHRDWPTPAGFDSPDT
jgi:NADH dehydrogenase [ubiquinone] 1 alpha subcomplex assembly factor 7